MRARGRQFEQDDGWDDDALSLDTESAGNYRAYDQSRVQEEFEHDEEHGVSRYDDDDAAWDDDRALMELEQAQGFMVQREQSLVNVSSTVTHHGTPLLSYTRTMNRFYTNRKQRLSLGRYSCEVCGERIRLWAWETPTGNRTHDGCYERLAWTWTTMYAQQQRVAAEGTFE